MLALLAGKRRVRYRVIGIIGLTVTELFLSVACGERAAGLTKRAACWSNELVSFKVAGTAVVLAGNVVTVAVGVVQKAVCSKHID